MSDLCRRGLRGVMIAAVLLMAGWHLSVAGDEGETDLSTSESTATEEEGSTRPVIPPEVLEQLMHQSNMKPNQDILLLPQRIGPTRRILLFGLAGAILAGAVILCRYLYHQTSWLNGENEIFLLFGFFGSIAALVIACVCVGSIFLHLAAAACTAVSGFAISAFLVPQFATLRRWVTGVSCPEVKEDKK